METFDLKMLWDGYRIIGDLLPFTARFPRADIHKLLTPDLLHQIIKGTFKDHLVMWVGEYLVTEHGEVRAAIIMADIDCRIAAVPSFPGLRHFHKGRGFKQWTGDDSKALMKVYLPAIVGHVPSQMVRALSAFLDFCYLVCRPSLTEDTLIAIDDTVERFHTNREIFKDAGIRPNGFSLPRQHSLMHYCHLIQQFGAPGGLCSSITESKHIKAVKEPWRRSSHFNALGQMLIMNQRLDKVAACYVDFIARGMLDTPLVAPHQTIVTIPPIEPDDGPVEGEHILATVVLAKTKVRGYPRHLHTIAAKIDQPDLPNLIRRFLFNQAFPDSAVSGSEINISGCLAAPTQIKVFHSVVATYYAPSDISGVSGMHQHWIHSNPIWCDNSARRDCVFAEKDPDLAGFRGLYAA